MPSSNNAGSLLSNLSKGVVRTTLVALGGAVGEHLLELHKQTVAASHSTGSGKPAAAPSHGNSGGGPVGPSKAVPLLEDISDHTLVTATNSKATLDAVGALAPILSDIASSSRTMSDQLVDIHSSIDDNAHAWAQQVAHREAADKAAQALQQNMVTVLKKGMGVDEYSFLKAAKGDHGTGGGDGKGLFGKIFGGTALGEMAAKLFGKGGALGFIGTIFAPIRKLLGSFSGGLMKGLGGLGKFAFRVLGPLASLTDGVVHAWQGWSDKATDKLLGSHTMSDKLQAAAINMLSGMTMGIVSPERIRDITERMSDWLSKRVLDPIFATFTVAVDDFKKMSLWFQQQWQSMQAGWQHKVVEPVEHVLDWIKDKMDAITHVGHRAVNAVKHAGEDWLHGLKSEFNVGKAFVTGGPSAARAQITAEQHGWQQSMAAQDAENAKVDAGYRSKVAARAAGQRGADMKRELNLSHQQAGLDKQSRQLDKESAADEDNLGQTYDAAGRAWAGTGSAIAGAGSAAATGVSNVGGEVGRAVAGVAGADLLPGSRPSSVGQPVASPDLAVVGDATDKRVLDAIAAGESDSSGGYNAVFGMKGGMAGLTSMTLGQVLALQKQRTDDGVYSSAVGRYQFIRSTLQGLIRKLGLSLDDKFSPETQDKLALSLLDEVGRQQYKAGRISAAQYQRGIASKWMSIGDPVTGRGTHDDDGVNHASARATGLVTAALTGAPSPTALPGRGAAAAGAGMVATAGAPTAAAPESATSMSDAIGMLRSQMEKAASAAGGAGPAVAAAAAPGDASGFMSLDSITMLPTDPGLMAINTGMV